MIVSDHTFEHIEEPGTTTREIDRVLKPGGWICARTTNRYGYIALFNMMIPKMLRRGSLHMAQQDRKEHDVFPAFYRLNTERALRRYFDPARYDHFSYTLDTEPSYHFSSPLAYSFFLFVHAISPPQFKHTRLIFMRKRA